MKKNNYFDDANTSKDKGKKNKNNKRQIEPLDSEGIKSDSTNKSKSSNMGKKTQVANHPLESSGLYDLKPNMYDNQTPVMSEGLQDHIGSSSSNLKIVRRRKASIFDDDADIQHPRKRQTEEEILKTNKCWPTFLTILTYLISEQKKKQRSFQIGVFTIFLVVSFLTLLKSAVDVAPVAFVKIGQDQSGAIDFRLTPTTTSAFEDGNRNFYADFPSWYNNTDPSVQKYTNQRKGLTDEEDAVDVDGFKILKFDVFEKKLKNLSGFEGFAPRWTLITKLRNISNPLLNSSSLLLVIVNIHKYLNQFLQDSKKEVDIGLGRYFSQTILGENDIMVTNSALRYLGVNPQNKEQVELYFSYQMFCQILGVCGAESGIYDSLNQTLGGELDPKTVDSVLKNGTFSKQQVYSLLRASGLNIAADNTIELNVTDQLGNFLNVFGTTNLSLSKQEIDDLLPDLNLAGFTVNATNLNGQNIDLSSLGIAGLNFNINSTEYIGNLNLTNVSAQVGNITINPANFINEDINITVDTFVKNFLSNRNITTVRLNLDPIVEELLANGVIPTKITAKYQVVEGFDSPNGKFSDTLGNVALIDCHSVGHKLRELYGGFIESFRGINPTMFNLLISSYPDFENFIPANFDLCPYALQIEGILTKGVKYYILDDREMENELAKKGTAIVDRVSLQTNATMSTPLMTQVKQIGMVRIFLSSSMGTVVFFLGILSVVLIYSLMLSDVDEKTYSYGMLRALGFRNKSLMGLISMQSFSFSIPGLLSGILVAYFMNLIVRYLIFVYAENTTDYNLSPGAIVLGSLLGILLPIVANIIPIQKALSKNLRVSLDLYHRSVNELTVSIKRLEEMGLSVNQLIVSIMLVFLGVLTYYVAPMAFIYKNYSLFFFILNFILILMILGLAFVSILLLPYIQILFVKIFILIMRKDKNLYQVIRKNLQGHEARNTKTAMMFCIALSFLIFAGSTFELIGHMIISQLESTVGSDLYATSIASKLNFIDEGPLIQFLEEQKLKDGSVHSYSFATGDINELLKMVAPNSNSVQKIYLGSACGYNQVATKVFGLQKNFLKVVNTEYYMPRETQSGLNLQKLDSGDYDSVEALFSNQGLDFDDGTRDPFNITVGYNWQTQSNFTEQIKILAPEGFRDALSLDTQTQARICARYQYNGTDSCANVYRAKIRAMITKIPGFLFMSYRQIAFFGSILISNEQYLDLLNDLLNANQDMKNSYQNLIRDYNFTDGIPKEYLFIKLKPNIDDYRREYIANGVRSYFRDDTTILLDRKSLLDSINSSLLLFQIFVIIVGTIALTLSFFLLLISTTSNIKENLWEFGVIRAIGLTKEQTKRVFMYEAFAVIFGALTLGIVVGLTVAITLTAQFYLFIELPFKLSFPTYLFISMIIMSLFTTYFAVLIPVRDVNNRKIATVLKGGV